MANDDDWLRSWLSRLLAAVPMVGWVLFVVWSGFLHHSATDPADVPNQLRLVGAASGTALAAIAGGFLGFKPEPIRERLHRVRLSAAGWATATYFLGLFAAVLIWAFDGQRAYAADVIQTGLATLFGFGIGAIKALTSPAT